MTFSLSTLTQVLFLFLLTFSKDLIAQEFSDDEFWKETIEQIQRTPEFLLEEKKNKEKLEQEKALEANKRAREQFLKREIELSNKKVLKSKRPKGTPSFFPTELDRSINNYMLILPFVCAKGQEIKWHATYESFINGLKPGSRIKAYSRQGDSANGSLGSPQCFIGECKANYVALPIETDTAMEGIIVVSKPKSIVTSRIEISTPKECEGIPSKKEDPYGFGFDSLPTTCNDILESASDTKPIGQIISFGWRQRNGWDVFEQFYRSLNYGSDGKKIFGELSKIAYTTHKQYPLFGFTNNGDSKSLLWYERSGLGPVSSFTLKESINDNTSKIKWVAEYKSGGQPCD